MDISGTSTDSLTAIKQPDAYSGLKTDQFIKIMFTELSNQDPTKPNDSAALLQQISSIRQIQSDIDMGAKLESLVSENQFAGASTMIGKLVSGVSEDNDRVVGKVLSVSRTDTGPVLNLDDGSRVAFGNVDEMVDPAYLQDPTDPPPPPTPPPSTPPNNDDQQRHDEENG
jgi:flagellar basal-body rod modification protein FlgD